MPHDCDIDADDMSEVPTSNGCTFCDRATTTVVTFLTVGRKTGASARR